MGMVWPQLHIKTVAVLPEGCFSALLWDGRPFAVTLERTFEDGKPVIGNGQYPCHRGFFHHGGYPTFEIQVAGHTNIKFHKGNWETDSKGCVLIGESFAELNGQMAIADSGHGFNEFMNIVEGLDNFTLLVTGR